MVSFVCCLLSAVEVDLGNFDVMNINYDMEI
jgi:hypothetical protein